MLERNDRIRSRVHTRCVDRHLAKEEASSEFADAQTVCEELISGFISPKEILISLNNWALALLATKTFSVIIRT